MTRPESSATEQRLREELTKALGKRPYRMWFTNTTVRCHDHSVEILAATPLAAGWIRDRFSAVVEDVAKITFGREVQVHISVDEKQVDACNQHRPQPQQKQTPARPKRRHFLSFDDFVVGTCNQLACAAAKQISQEDGGSISPLFIHGACGVGKTHLLQAICKVAAKASPGKVRYVTAEQFTNEFIASSRCGEFGRFRNRYRHLDLLAVDDIHFVASKTKTQEELLHTLDAAGLRGARLVFASDEDPRHIRRLNRSLTNRFVAGMIAEIQRPDRDTRRSIINKLTLKHGIELTEGGIDRLASQAVGSVREIEGAVTRLRATASLLMQNETSAIGIDIVDRLLRSTPQPAHTVRMADVIEVVSTRSGITIPEIKGRSRTSSIVLWRSIASYMGRRLTSHSYPELAIALGRKNHSTVHAAVKKITLLLTQPCAKIQHGGESINLQEVIDQLSWTIRARASEGSTAKQRSHVVSERE